jgi:cobalt-zinc-cadmium resistance protein CzcA
LPPETSLDESARIAFLVAEKLIEVPDIERVITATGKAKGAEHTAPVNLTHTNCVLVPKEQRHRSIQDIKADIRKATQHIPGVVIQINAPLQHRISHVVTGIRSDIAVKIFGENYNSIQAIAQQVYNEIDPIRGVADLQIEQSSGVPQIQYRFDRLKLARYGLNVKDVGDFIEIALNGKVATEVLETRKRFEVFVRFKEDSRLSQEQIQNLYLQTPSGYRIPISEVAQIIEYRNPQVIRRENALRRTIVQCNVADRDVGSLVREIRSRISQIDLPEGYFIQFGGTYENQMRAMRQLTLVVFFTILIVFTLLWYSFNSFKNAVLIMINVPFAVAGGMIVLFLSGNTLSVPSIVGFIALIGIAVQDGIVLVSHINRKRNQGLKIEEAVVQAGTQKIRPVLMTTFTTMLGLLPLAIRSATGSEIQKPLAFVVMFGLLFSTLITLVLLPTLYAGLEKEKTQAGE